MKKSIVICITVFFAAAIATSFQKEENQARVIIQQMLQAIRAHKGAKFTMGNNERIVGMSGLRGGNIYTKVQVNPFKVYMKMLTDPNKGTEILYVPSERDGKALIKPGNLFFNVKLSPFNSQVTKNQHHSPVSAGFGMVVKIIEAGVKRADAEKKFDEVFRYAGEITYQNKPCYKIVIEDPTWAITTYKASKGETLFSISQKLLIPEYSITELNGVSNFEEDLGGRTLKVPTSYAKKTVFYIDKSNHFPIYQEMSDDKGVFERYEFFNLIINPVFAPDEFSENFKEYGF
ncbi:MAG: DUF1571 domain-containing protein [Chitinophagales bacterium]|nr:DUF1571 domain-containing protein [Chitinophagales bacterium]MDW8419628.1 DUF1571 domain-containing protein [Chitinophagales bacterium]